jgi:hypothetical protein
MSAGPASGPHGDRSMPLSVTLTPLPLLKRSGGLLLRGIRVTFGCTGGQEGAAAFLELSDGRGRTLHELGLPGPGDRNVTVFVPEVPGDETILAHMRCGPETATAQMPISPARRWIVHLVLHSHTDLGFTDTITEIAKIHNENTDRAIDLCNETSGWPAGSRFKWTCEVSWQVQQYIAHRSPEKVEELMRLVRQGSIGIGAMYTGQLPDILGHEEAARTFAYAGYLRHRYGIPCTTAMLCDVPGFTTGMVQIMAKSGVPNLIIADNNFIAPVLERTDLPRPFWWRGADGTKILCWYTDHPYFAYIEGEHYGFTADADAVARLLPEKLRSLEESGYPFDRLQLQYAFDNARLDTRPLDIVRTWNETWEYPKVVLSTADEFLTYLGRHHGATIPLRTGDWTNWWSGISSGFPVEAAISRRCHDRAPAAEMLWAAASIRNPAFAFPVDEFNRVYDGLLAFDEHSGGGTLWQPRSQDHQDAALREGFGQLYEAEERLGRLEDRIAGTAPDAQMLVVINPTGEARSEWVPCPSLPGGWVHASGVPPYGYRSYAIDGEVDAGLPPEGMADISERPGRVLLSNPFTRITIDRESGFCTSLVILPEGRELIGGQEFFNRPLVYEMQPVVPIELGKYIPEVYTGVENPGRYRPWPGRSRPVLEPSFDPIRGAACTVSHVIAGRVWLSQEYLLPHGSTRVHVSNRLSRAVCDDQLLRGELADFLTRAGLLYFGFSFDIGGGVFEYESPASIVCPAEDQFAAACRDFFAVGRWCRISNEERSIAVSSPDIPLVDVGSIGLLRFKRQLDANQSSLFFRAVALRDWGTELESPYSRERDLLFRFGLDTAPLPPDPAERRRVGRAMAHSLGLSCHSPLRAIPLARDGAGIFARPAGAWSSVRPDNVEIMTLKRARFTDQVLLRCREIAGRPAQASIAIPGFQIVSAQSTSITEEPVEPMEVHGNTLHAEFAPFAIRSYLLTLRREAIPDANA